MSQNIVERVVGMLITDGEFRRRFEKSPVGMLAGLREQGLSLTEAEAGVLADVDVQLWSRLATQVDRRLHRAGTGARPLVRRPLTRREQEVLRGVVDGLTNKQIAAEIRASESAIKATLQKLFRKVRVRTRAQLVRVALEGLPASAQQGA